METKIVTWVRPVDFILTPTQHPDSYHTMGVRETGLPLAPHPGAYGVKRKHHTHEGVDLYVPLGTIVRAVEAGVIVAIKPFTGPLANLPWWRDTWAVFVEGASGVVVYGEIQPLVSLVVNQVIAQGEHLGHVIPVLTKDKGRPMAMLHLELHTKGSRQAPEWLVHEEKPQQLQDPTPYLITAR